MSQLRSPLSRSTSVRDIHQRASDVLLGLLYRLCAIHFASRAGVRISNIDKGFLITYRLEYSTRVNAANAYSITIAPPFLSLKRWITRLCRGSANDWNFLGFLLIINQTCPFDLPFLGSSWATDTIDLRI